MANGQARKMLLFESCYCYSDTSDIYHYCILAPIPSQAITTVDSLGSHHKFTQYCLIL